MWVTAALGNKNKIWKSLKGERFATLTTRVIPNSNYHVDAQLCLSVRLLAWRSLSVCLYLSACLSVCLSVCLPVLSVCLCHTPDYVALIKTEYKAFTYTTGIKWVDYLMLWLARKIVLSAISVVLRTHLLYLLNGWVANAAYACGGWSGKETSSNQLNLDGWNGRECITTPIRDIM